MIIVGLGNPGKEYVGTRHNLGFQVLDQLAQDLHLEWTVERDVLVTRSGEHWLLKPQTYMNRSGQALKDFFSYKNISTESADIHRNLLVIHDELDFEPGQWKLQRGRSSAGHNGVQSIIDAMNTKDFERLRIGIGSGKSFNIPSEDFVLQTFPSTELPAIHVAVSEVVELIKKQLSV